MVVMIEVADMVEVADIVACTALPQVSATVPGVSLFDAGFGQCRWPLNDVSPIASFRVCGEPAASGLGCWCAVHSRIVYAAKRR
jgi:hypothetical protein